MNKTLIGLGVFIALASASALAGPPALPDFSASEERVIGRNEYLNALVSSDPWAVKGVLRLLQAVTSKNGSRGAVVRPHPESALPSQRGDKIDFAKNPDLATIGRSSPEAALDLLRLLKEASSKRPSANVR